MLEGNQDIKDKILMKALESVPFDGWAWAVVEEAAEKAGYERDMAGAVFSEKIPDVLKHFSAWIDNQTLEELEKVNSEPLRIRDKVSLGVETRIKVMNPYKESVRAASVYWLAPFRKIEAGKVVWSSADMIWNWAGDTAQDYNHYTKRLLLSGVITTTVLRWLEDNSDNNQETLAFLDRRIDNVLGIGKLIGKFKSFKTAQS